MREILGYKKNIPREVGLNIPDPYKRAPYARELLLAGATQLADELLLDGLSWVYVCGEEAGVFYFYLIDPVGRTVVKVNDGFDRAAELTNCEAPDLDTLWQDAAEPDSSVDIAYDPNAEDQPAFRLKITRGSATMERLVAGRAVLMLCGAVPDDIAQQLSAAEAVREAIGFVGKVRTDVAAWLKSGAPDTRAPARRSAVSGHARKHRHGTSRRR
ncbi:hypothetical protein H3V53_34865 [Paraburkholderia bengalensis]|uniref:Uncharacterized protein n=1 Tax=Paraburkholderia bengalensis TaxID=2747562 RepID=A0ABU8J340_9BURK